jgi:hypothetical protein
MEKPENIEMMNIMDRHLTKHPTEGVVHAIPINGYGLFSRSQAHTTLISNHGQAYDIQA